MIVLKYEFIARSYAIASKRTRTLLHYRQVLAPLLYAGLATFLAMVLDHVLELKFRTDHEHSWLVSTPILPLDPKSTDWTTPTKGAWFAARTGWGTATLIYFSVSFFIICSSLRSMSYNYTKCNYSATKSVISATACINYLGHILVLLGITSIFLDYPWRYVTDRGANFQLLRLSGVSLAPIQDLLPSAAYTRFAPIATNLIKSLTRVEQAELAVYLFGCLTGVSLVLAACSTLSFGTVFQGSRRETIEAETVQLSHSMYRLRIILYQGMAVLMMSVFQLASLQQWMIISVIGCAEIHQQHALQRQEQRERNIFRHQVAVLNSAQLIEDTLRESPCNPSLRFKGLDAVFKCREVVKNASKEVSAGRFFKDDQAKAALLTFLTTITLLEKTSHHRQDKKIQRLRQRSQEIVAAFSEMLRLLRASDPVSSVLASTSTLNLSNPATEASRGLEIVNHELLNKLALYWTLILASVYLPGSRFLSQRAQELAIRALNEVRGTATQGQLEHPTAHHLANADIHQWLKDRDLSSDWYSMVPRFAAVLAPLLTGFASQFLTSGLTLFR